MGRIYWTDNIFTAFTEYTKAPEVVETEEPKTTPIFLNSDKEWALIQNWRKSQNLKEYIKDERLCNIANERAIETNSMGQTDNHAGLINRYSDSTYRISENVTGSTSEEGVLNNWLSSTAHTNALKSNYNYSCVKCSGIWCVQIFSNF